MKKPVKYGTRFRGKQKKDTSSHTNEDEALVIESTTGTAPQSDDKKDDDAIPEGATGKKPVLVCVFVCLPV